jgi:hypothetical protein
MLSVAVGLAGEQLVFSRRELEDIGCIISLEASQITTQAPADDNSNCDRNNLNINIKKSSNTARTGSTTPTTKTAAAPTVPTPTADSKDNDACSPTGRTPQNNHNDNGHNDNDHNDNGHNDNNPNASVFLSLSRLRKLIAGRLKENPHSSISVPHWAFLELIPVSKDVCMIEDEGERIQKRFEERFGELKRGLSGGSGGTGRGESGGVREGVRKDRVGEEEVAETASKVEKEQVVSAKNTEDAETGGGKTSENGNTTDASAASGSKGTSKNTEGGEKPRPRNKTIRKPRQFGFEKKSGVIIASGNLSADLVRVRLSDSEHDRPTDSGALGNHLRDTDGDAFALDDNSDDRLVLDDEDRLQLGLPLSKDVTNGNSGNESHDIPDSDFQAPTSRYQTQSSESEPHHFRVLVKQFPQIMFRQHILPQARKDKK